MSQRGDLEAAVVAALEPLKKVGLSGGAAGGYLELVRAYQGSLDPDPDDNDLIELIGTRTPGALVTTGDGSYDEQSEARISKAELGFTVEVLVYSKNARSDEAKHAGDGISTDPGIYQAIEDVRGKLWNVEMGVSGVGFLVPSAETAVVRTGDIAIWRVTFDVIADVDSVDPTASDTLYDSRDVFANNADDDTIDPVVSQRSSVP